MSTSKIAFYRYKNSFHFDFSGEKITSDGGMLLLMKNLGRNRLLKYLLSSIPDRRHPSYVEHSLEQLLCLRVVLLCCAYEDCNDISHLKDDPALQSLFGSSLPSQSTLSRWENSMSLPDVARLAMRMIDSYVDSLDPKREYIIIDVDCTDDPTHGAQQGSLFHGYYWHYMYNELFYLDGETGQVILPVLRPGNVHSGKWNDRFLTLIIDKIRARFPDMVIHLRADAGFSSPAFYDCAEASDFSFCIGISANERLKKLIAQDEEEVKEQYVRIGQKHQRFVGPFQYQADSWKHPQDVYAKIESTGKGLNVRFYVSNYQEDDPEALYKEYYVQRGEAAENRIKEIKNFCFSDRLSCHRFSANYFRLILSCLAYELLRSIREQLPKATKDPKIRAWSVQSIRLYLIKVAAQIRITVRRVYFRFARGHPYQKVLTALLA